jgi:hypothetical protein
LLVIPVCCLRAQQQERKLEERIMKPDMSLQNDAQNKNFTADKTSVKKRARVSTFYVQQGSRTKNYSGTRNYSAREFNAGSFHNENEAVARNLSAKQAETSTYSATSRTQNGHPVHDHDKAQPGRDYAGNRPYLEKGKSQKFLNRKNRPMTIDEVRDLLNKNR